jgi:hypothetical protein
MYYSSLVYIFYLNMICNPILPDCFVFRLLDNTFSPSVMFMCLLAPIAFIIFIVFIIITIKLIIIAVMDRKAENKNIVLIRNIKINVLLICIAIIIPRIFVYSFEEYTLYSLTIKYNNIVNALDEYKSAKGHYPSELDQLVPVYIDEIHDLHIAECDGGCSYYYKNEQYKPFFEDAEYDYELNIEIPRFRHPPTELYYRPSNSSTITIKDDYIYYYRLNDDWIAVVYH